MRTAAIVAACAVMVSGCVSGGSLAQKAGIRTEAAAPSSANGVALREHQVDLVSLLRAALVDHVQIERLAAPTSNPLLRDCEERMRSQRDGGRAGPIVRCDRFRQTQYLSEASRLVLEVELFEDPIRQRQIRNTVAGQLIDASVKNCNVYLQSLRGGQVASRTIFDFLSAGFGVAGGLATPERSANLLSSLGAMSTATGSSIDRNVFAEKGVELVADEIEKARNRRWTELERKATLSYGDWSLSFALADISAFHGDCSMLKGLGLMRDAVVTRDLLVRAARLSAAKAAREGASGAAVAAAIAGLEEATLGEDGEAGGSPPGGALGPTGVRFDARDLERRRATALGCLDELKGVLKADPSKTPKAVAEDAEFKKGACSDAAWAGRINRIALDLAAGSTDLAAAQAPDSDEEIKDKAAAEIHAVAAAQTALAQAQASLAEAKKASEAAPDDDALKLKVAAAEKAVTDAEAGKKAASDGLTAKKNALRNQELDAASAALKQAAREKMDLEIAMTAAARSAAMQYANTAAEQGASATQVAEILKRVAGELYKEGQAASNDPVLAAMIHAAEGIAKSPDTTASGRMAAQVALAAGHAYLSSYDQNIQQIA